MSIYETEQRSREQGFYFAVELVLPRYKQLGSDRERPMTRADIRLEVVLNGVRWANNIITELLSNHGSVLPSASRNALMSATRLLSEVVDAVRSAQEGGAL